MTIKKYFGVLQLLTESKSLKPKNINKTNRVLMTKAEKRKVANYIQLIALVVSTIGVWIVYYLIGSPSFNKENAISIYGTIVQGMSALLSVSIAVIIFRIQSLENRNQSLEQSTINYVYQITQLIYPKWLPCLEEHIRSGIITQRYYEGRKNTYSARKSESDLEKDRGDQQNRLMESLSEHVKVEETIQQTGKGAIWSFGLLVSPIFFSLFLLLISDAMEQWFNFYFVSLVVLLSAFGIFSLINTVANSILPK